MKQKLNKLLFVFILIVIMNIIPTTAKASQFQYNVGNDLNGQPLWLNVNLNDYAGNIVTTFPKDSLVIVNANINCVNACSNFVVYENSPAAGYNLIPLYSAGDIPTHAYNHVGNTAFNISADSTVEFQYYPVPWSNGLFFTTSTLTVYTPYVKVYVYNDTNPASPVLIPQNGSRITTSSVSSGTPLKFDWSVYNPSELGTGLYNYFRCKTPDGMPQLTNKSFGTYRTTATSSTATYPFSCYNPQQVFIRAMQTGIGRDIINDNLVTVFSGEAAYTGNLNIVERGIYVWPQANTGHGITLGVMYDVGGGELPSFVGGNKIISTTGVVSKNKNEYFGAGATSVLPAPSGSSSYYFVAYVRDSTTGSYFVSYPLSVGQNN